MKPDEHICLCFHVTKRKVVNFIRVEQPRRASQLSECFGAGTGCGWCRSLLQRIFDEREELILDVESSFDGEPDFEEHADSRATYVREGGGTPPAGATPIAGIRDKPSDQQDV